MLWRLWVEGSFLSIYNISHEIDLFCVSPSQLSLFLYSFPFSFNFTFNIPSPCLFRLCLFCIYLLIFHFFFTMPSLISNLVFFFVFLFLFFLYLPCALPTRSTDSVHNSTLMVKEFMHFPLSLLQNAWKRRKIRRKWAF